MPQPAPKQQPPIGTPLGQWATVNGGPQFYLARVDKYSGGMIIIKDVRGPLKANDGSTEIFDNLNPLLEAYDHSIKTDQYRGLHLQKGDIIWVKKGELVITPRGAKDYWKFGYVPVYCEVAAARQDSK